MNTRRLVTNAILLALLIISAFIKIPTSFIPFTMQLLIALVISLMARPLDGALIFITYIIMGLVGIPIFANGGGMGYLFLPSFGFILGFLVMNLVIAILKKSMKPLQNNYFRYLIMAVIGLVTLYTVGVFYALIIFNIYENQHYQVQKLLEIMVTPFILFDLIKCLIASLVVTRLEKAKLIS